MIWRRVASSSTVAASTALKTNGIISSQHIRQTFQLTTHASTFQSFSTTTPPPPASTKYNFESAIRHLQQSKNKDKCFTVEILKNISPSSPSSPFNPAELTPLLQLIQKYSLNSATLTSLITTCNISYDALISEQLETIIDLFSTSPLPTKAAEFTPIITFLTQCDERLASAFDLQNFLKSFNACLLAERSEIDITTLTTWINDLQSVNSRIEFNGVLTEKLYDELYDKTESEWLQVIRVYSRNGNLDIELLQEFDKQVNIDSLATNDINLFTHYLELCAAKDFKPSNINALHEKLKNHILSLGQLVAPFYLESLQYSQPQFLSSIFESLLQNGVDPRQIEATSGCSRDFLRAFKVIPQKNVDLVEIIQAKKNTAILAYVREQKQLKSEREHALTIHEMFLIAKYIKESDMSGRKRAAKELDLPNLISDIEVSLLTEMHGLVNRFMKEKQYKKATTLRSFFEVNCISHCLGFEKQAVECFEATFSPLKSQFSKVFVLPLLAEFGKINADLFIQIVPEYSAYVVSKYIARNQLDFEEALIILRCVYAMKDLYLERNAKYQNKEFVYGVKGITRLAILTFQKRIYSNFSDVKAKDPNVSNPFLEPQPLLRTRSKFQEQQKGTQIEFTQDLNASEIDQFLELFAFANSMNVGSKEFYDSLPLFALAYYEKHLSIEQKSVVAYLISTIDSSDERIEKLIESQIENNTSSFTLLQASRFLSFLTTRYCLNEDLWKKLIRVVQAHEGEIQHGLPDEIKLSLALTRECLRLEQPHVKFEMSQAVADHLHGVFVKDQMELAKRSTKFSEAISYFLTRLGYYHEKEQKQSIFSFMFSQVQTQSYLIVLDKLSFIGDTKAQRASVSVMIRMLTKLNLKLKIFNVYDWATKEKRSEKVAYLKSKVKGMAFDPEKQKRKSHFNF